jgi:hypothetical protein
MTVLWPDAAWLVSELSGQGYFVWAEERDPHLVLGVAGLSRDRHVLLTRADGDWRVTLYDDAKSTLDCVGVLVQDVPALSGILLRMGL